MKESAARLVTLGDPRSPAAEAYRTLRANLQFSRLDKPPRTLLVAGAGVEDDKSATLCNLAVVVAQAGQRVIVADGDLRRPSVHRIFDLANDKGLTTALLGDPAGELPLQQTSVPGLRALTAGPPPLNPADLLAGPGMQRIIDTLAASADLVLFDAPPVVLVSDAALLASRLDGAILVVSAGKTRREVAATAKEILEKAGAEILGVVLDNVPANSLLSRYGDGR